MLRLLPRVALLLFIFVLQAFASAAVITGTVMAKAPAVNPPQVISGVSVSLIQGGVVVDATTTDANGMYSFSGIAAGNYSLEFTKPNFVKTRVLNITLTDSQVLLANVGITPAPKLSAQGTNQQAQTKHWRVRNPLTFSVSYTWQDLDSNATGSGVATPGDSTFDTPLNASGPTRVRLLVNGIQVRANSGTTVDLPPSTGVVSGTVHDLSNLPISGATITLTNTDTNDVVVTSTAIDGTYAFNDVPAGAYTVNGTGTNLNSSTTPITVNAGESQVVDFSLYLVAHVTIHVTVFGNPSTTSSINIQYTDATYGPSGATDSNGDCVLDLIANKPCFVIVGIIAFNGPPGGFPAGASTFNASFP